VSLRWHKHSPLQNHGTTMDTLAKSIFEPDKPTPAEVDNIGSHDDVLFNGRKSDSICA
jgi:hypothetical protein